MAFDLASLFKKTDLPKVASRAGILGVDIGTSSLKVVQLKSVKGVPTLETYGELQLGPYEGVPIGRNTHLPVQKIIEALVDIIREAGATAKEGVCALSYGSSFTSVISIPTLDHEQINNMLPIEARKYIPISLTKVSLDWKLVGIDEAARRSRVLVSAMYTEALERYDSIMKGCGINLIGKEAELFSAVRATVGSNDDVAVVIDFGSSATRLYIVEHGVVKKTHSTILSGIELSLALQKNASLTFEAAEELKRNVGLHGVSDDPRVQKAIVDTLDRGLRELHTVIARYADTEKVTIKKVYLCGGGSLLQGLPAYMSDMFSLPVELAHPFRKVGYPAFLEDTLKEAGPSFAVAIGVALNTFESTPNK